MLPSTAVVKRRLRLYCKKSNIRYIFCNKRFKAFLEVQMFKDKPTLCLQSKTYSFDAVACHLFQQRRLFLCSIYSLQV